VIVVVLALIFGGYIYRAASEDDPCADWKAKYEAIDKDFGHLSLNEREWYADDVAIGQVNSLRRKIRVLTLIDALRRRPPGCKHP
jgi:hypothetical protein